MVQQEGDDKWQIYLIEPMKGRDIPLSATGSGLKTVILVLVNLLVVPQLGRRTPLQNYLFAFEELENNLHPAAQRRLFRYLRHMAEETSCHFFLTTHSNVVIDLFANDELAQILHVTHDGTCSKVERFSSSSHGWNILDDLDVRASDLLQANSVIWVEGPSDRVYLNRWIELWSDAELQEGVHYQCVPYGGAVGKHFSFDEPEFAEDLIAALKVNRHAVFVADRDRTNADDELKPNTQRLLSEVRKVGGFGFVTTGKEIENYIPVEAWRKLLNNEGVRGPRPFTDAVAFATSGLGRKQSKIRLATQIIPLLDREMLATTLDLASRLDELCDKLREWNRLPSVRSVSQSVGTNIDAS